MTDSEARRIKLLEEARKFNGNTYDLPPIHPRYKGISRNLSRVEESKNNSTLGIRTIIACVLLMAFISADTEHITYKGWDTGKISSQITRNLDVKTIWKSL